MMFGPLAIHRPFSRFWWAQASMLTASLVASVAGWQVAFAVEVSPLWWTFGVWGDADLRMYTVAIGPLEIRWLADEDVPRLPNAWAHTTIGDLIRVNVSPLPWHWYGLLSAPGRVRCGPVYAVWGDA